jgi:hypothetical protein
MKRVFRLPGTRRRAGDELDDELRFHLDGRVEDIMAREHLSRDDAEREARRRFGDYDAYRSETRNIDDGILKRRRQMDIIETLKRETRHAARTLARSPSFSFIAIVTLALGLGAATTIFTLLDRVVLRPLPYPNADRLVHIGTLWPKSKAGEEYGIARGQYFYFKNRSRSLADIAFYDYSIMVVPGDGDHPAERVPEIDASASTFAMFGIRPQLGRLFTAADELNPDGDPRVVLLSDGYWRRRFGADPNVIGKAHLVRHALGRNHRRARPRERAFRVREPMSGSETRSTRTRSRRTITLISGSPCSSRERLSPAHWRSSSSYRLNSSATIRTSTARPLSIAPASR